MKAKRDLILDWIDQGSIADARFRDALEHVGGVPDAAAWRRFLDRLLLFLGVSLLAAGTIFFFAFNWHALGRMTKFALVELPLVATLGFAGWRGVDGRAGQAVLLLASLLVGALLALVGQTYQTGADTYELFTVWALALLPWVLLARFAALWVLWLVLVNMATVLFYTVSVDAFFGFPVVSETLWWVLFWLNTAALAAWELAAVKLAWLRERWAARTLATAGGTLLTTLACRYIDDPSRSGYASVPLWLVWVAVVYRTYRFVVKDLFMLAGVVLSGLVVATTLWFENVPSKSAGALFFAGIIVIGLSAVGSLWLKSVAAEENL